MFERAHINVSLAEETEDKFTADGDTSINTDIDIPPAYAIPATFYLLAISTASMQNIIEAQDEGVVPENVSAAIGLIRNWAESQGFHFDTGEQKIH